MRNLKINDWQDMSLKKDVEVIIKKLNDNQSIFFSICWEIVIAIGVVMVDHFFDTNNTPLYIWVVCILLAILPPVIIIVIKVKGWIETILRVKSGVYDVKKFVDSFDNQICYYVLIANSYNEMFKGSSNITDVEKVFIYQELSYYLNKTISKLYEMKPVINKVFYEYEDDKVKKAKVEKAKVEIGRLCILIEMMHMYYCDANLEIESLKNNVYIKQQISINLTYIKHINSIIKDINILFSPNLEEWDILNCNK